MTQPSSTNLRPSFQQSCKSFVAKSWRIVPVMLLLALCLLVGQQGVAHAATRTSATVSHVQSARYLCDYRTYQIASTLELTRNSDGTVYDFQANNMNGYYTVQVTVDGTYQGEYNVPTYYTPQIYIYVGNDGNEYAKACLD